MWKFIISFLVLVISLPYSAFGIITVSGTVIDENSNPLEFASVQLLTAAGQPTSFGVDANTNGYFEIETTADNQKIQIYYMGYETKTLNATGSLGTIQLKPSAKTTLLSEVLIENADCKEPKHLEPLHATAARNIEEAPTQCYPTECKSTYKLVGSGQNATCKSRNGDPCDKTDLGNMYGTAGTYTCDTDKCICNITECNTELYQQKPNKQGKCVSLSGTKCDINNAKKSAYVCTETSCVCKVTECDKNYVPNADGTECVSTKCQNCQIWDDSKKQCTDDIEIDNSCTDKISNSKTATYTCESNVKSCTLTDCNPGYQKRNNQCESLSGTTCSNPPPHATDTYRTFDNSGNEFCHVVTCKGGYEPSDDGATCVPAKEYDMDALEQNADQAHENENSLANRMLGGASMAAMGIGGMELAQGLAQQRADAKADADMTAYLATFRCEYGPNHADGNTTGNEVPGANQLFDLYQEYAALASSVKATKEALNMTPGIESQVILDKANIGLYDDVSTGKTNGTYASLYRAKMGGDVDQAKLQEMSDTSKNRVVGGAVAAGAGAIAGIGGDVLLNQIDWNKNNSDTQKMQNKK